MNVIDLFAGVGGLSLGASRAGFNLAAAVELDKNAISSHEINFPNSVHLHEDVSKLNAREIFDSCGVSSIECVIGGPPCQGFSSIGKGMAEDSRNELYGHFFRLVNEIKPFCFLAENVPGILNKKYDSIRKSAFGLLNDDYFLLRPIEVKAFNYGAPTVRKRIFFIGFRKDVGLRHPSEEDFYPPDTLLPVFVKDALYGLPEYIDGKWQSDEFSWRKIIKDRSNYFYDRLWGHVPPNVGDLNALSKLSENLVSGCSGTIHSELVLNRYNNLLPGRMDKISRSIRLEPEGFCPTLRAGTGSDKGSFQAVRPIHPSQPRVITPREAARLQGFPDWFQFHETKWHSFRQIGNSVSPLVAEIMLLPLFNYCNKVKEELSNTKELSCSIQ